MLVSKLAVLFHTLAEDVRSVAEDAGLKWQWRKVEGKVEGLWEGDCDKVWNGRNLQNDMRAPQTCSAKSCCIPFPVPRLGTLPDSKMKG